MGVHRGENEHFMNLTIELREVFTDAIQLQFVSDKCDLRL